MNFNRLPVRGKRPSHRLARIDTDSEEEAFKFNFGGPKLISRPSKSFVLARRLKYSLLCKSVFMDSTSLTTASVAEISRLRADKALGEFIGGPEEAQLLEVSGQDFRLEMTQDSANAVNSVAALCERRIICSDWSSSLSTHGESCRKTTVILNGKRFDSRSPKTLARFAKGLCSPPAGVPARRVLCLFDSAANELQAFAGEKSVHWRSQRSASFWRSQDRLSVKVTEDSANVVIVDGAALSAPPFFRRVIERI